MKRAKITLALTCGGQGQGTGVKSYLSPVIARSGLQAAFYTRHLTPRRAFNQALLIAGYHRARMLRSPRQWAMPSAISVEPTTACNLRCPECPSGLRSFTRPTGTLKRDLFERLLNQTAPWLQHLTFYFQGEPFIHPHLLDMVAEAHARGIYTLTSTNAHFIGPAAARHMVQAGLQKLVVSLDGTTQEVYEQYRRGGSLERVLEGTRQVVEAKRSAGSATPQVVFQFLVVRPNEHQIAAARSLAAEIGVDAIDFKTAQIYDYQEGHPLIPTLDRFARYRRLDDGSWQLKNKLPNQCWKMWHSSVMTWDGRIVPCCFDKDATHLMGHLQYSSFKEIWMGEPYRRFRAALLRSRKEIDICTNCSEGTRVWA